MFCLKVAHKKDNKKKHDVVGVFRLSVKKPERIDNHTHLEQRKKNHKKQMITQSEKVKFQERGKRG